MRCDSYSCIGESHIASGKPCQDRSLHFCDEEKGVCIVVVCDGHGGDRYFRSDVGAQLLSDITKDSVLKFVEVIDKHNEGKDDKIFSKCEFTQVPVLRSRDESAVCGNEEEFRLNQLFTSIVAQWKKKIDEDAQRPLTDWERANVKPEYQDAFKSGVNIEKSYGCTLMAFVQTRDYWIAFHIGDGKCIMFNKSDECIEPILWDDKCFLNRTTSICDPAPIEEFRYSYCGSGENPVAVFLGSDGIDDSYGDGERLHNFYLNIMRCLVKDGEEAVHNSLVEDLPSISRMGSQDDMSIAFIYDENSIAEHTRILTEKQVLQVEGELIDLQERLRAKGRTIDEFAGEYENKRNNLRPDELDTPQKKACEKLRINLKYAYSDYLQLKKERDAMRRQALSLYDFLGEEPKVYKLSEDNSKYLSRIPSFINGSYGKQCDAEKIRQLENSCDIDSLKSDETVVENVTADNMPCLNATESVKSAPDHGSQLKDEANDNPKEPECLQSVNGSEINADSETISPNIAENEVISDHSDDNVPASVSEPSSNQNTNGDIDANIDSPIDTKDEMK